MLKLGEKFECGDVDCDDVGVNVDFDDDGGERERLVYTYVCM